MTFDSYPYPAGSTVLTQLVPQWALEGGLKGLFARLASAANRAVIAAESATAYQDRWADIYITSVASPRNSGLEGQTIAAIARGRGHDPVETALDLLQEEQGDVQIISFGQSEENLRQLLTHPLSMVICDGFYSEVPGSSAIVCYVPGAPRPDVPRARLDEVAPSDS